MKIKQRSLIHLFFASAILGPGFGYGRIYLFHIALVIVSLLFLARGLTKKKTPLEKFNYKYIAPFVILLMWYVAGLFWTWSVEYTFVYIVYILFGVVIVFYLLAYVSNVERFEEVVSVVGVCLIGMMIVGGLEALALFRWPTSPYSDYARFFGRDATDMFQFREDTVSIIESTPTGFLGNPNNFAVVIASISPFFLIKRKALHLLLYCSCIALVIFSGSRGSLFGAGVGLVLYLLLNRQFKIIFAIIFVFALFSVYINSWLYDLKSSSNIRILDAVNTIDALVSYLTKEGEAGASISARHELIENGLAAFRESYGLGVGGGASKSVQEAAGWVGGRLTSMHNFWIEILVEGGVIGFIVFGGWYVWVVIQLLKAFFTTDSMFVRQGSLALVLSLAVFSISCISASSVIYLLPMWMLFGLSIAFIRIGRLGRFYGRA